MRPLTDEDIELQITQYRGSYISYAKRMHPALDPEEVLQQALVMLVKRRHKLQMPHDSGMKRQTWVRNVLYKTIQYAGQNLFRKEKLSRGKRTSPAAQDFVVVPFVLTDDEDDEFDIQIGETNEDFTEIEVESLLDSLENSTQKAIFKAKILGYSLPEIAKRLNLTPSRTRREFRRGKAILRWRHDGEGNSSTGRT